MSIWKSLTLILSLRCEHASKIASHALDGEVTAGERWALYLHTVICANCNRFVKQIGWIQSALQQESERIAAEPIDTSDCLPAESRQRIQQAIVEQLQE